MAVKFATNLRNARADAITTFAGSSALIRIYDGTRPASPATAVSTQNLLATLTCNATFAAAASNGVLTLNAITQDSSADATGTASWFRMVKSDGSTVVMDGDVGTSGADLNLNTTSIVSGGPVSITSFTVTEGNS
jgi:hypothetical protein